MYADVATARQDGLLTRPGGAPRYARRVTAPSSARLPALAVIGGGQLARMMAQAAVALGVPLRLLAEGADVSAAQVVPRPDGRRLPRPRRRCATVAEGCAVVTFDHEHVPTEHLHALAAEGHACRPGPDGAGARPGQGRDAGPARRPRRARARGTASWPTPRRSAAFAASVGGFPVVLKTTRGGYDGKGVWVVASADDCADAVRGGRLDRRRRSSPRRRSTSAASCPRWWPGRPPARSRPTRSSSRSSVDGICWEVIAPAPDLDEELAVEAQRIAMRVAAELDVTGILAVELFETRDGRVLVNELAMRPHNTGHWTHGRRGHRPVREPPARRPRPAARLARGRAPRGR